MNKVRLALIGFGRWGRNYVKAAEDSGEAEVAVVINNGDGLTEAMHKCDAYVYAGHPRDAVWACDVALDLGRPILCEKPAGLSLAAAESIAAAESASKAFVLVGHQHLFADGYEALRSQGRPKYVESFFFGPVVRPDYSATWDYGPHAVACLLGLDADPTTHPMSWWHAGHHCEAEKMAYVFTADDDWRVNQRCNRSFYNGYAPQEPPLTRQVRAFARAVKAGGTDDYRFGAKWAVDVARVLEAAEARLDRK